MEFEVTATRKRPKTLAEMVGQDFVRATLSSALDSGKLAHAYLFSGPRGTGKTSTARILARSVNCESGPTSSPCGQCPACVEIGKGSSPDVIEIDGASNTSVNDVRGIKDEVLYAPQSSRKKVYIIDEVHMLSNSAFNALLKTIEEPPPYIVFVFATTEVHKVPATIRSRCQQFRFRLFAPELIQDKLKEAAGEMEREFEDDALFWIAREAGGSLRDAYTLFDQVLSFSGGKITLEGIREKMGLMGLESASRLLSAAAGGERTEALNILDEILSSGTAVEQVLAELADYLRNLMLLACGIEKVSLLGMAPERFPRELREAWDVRRLETAGEDAFSLYRDIRYSLNPRYELELFVGRLCGLSQRMLPEEILGRVKALRRELSGSSSAEEPARAAAPDEVPRWEPPPKSQFRPAASA
ncbi:MAG: DNA polymerase III, subunit gamma and tau, partial [Spirochaetales bacterium]